jgi:hypothetical protein
MAALQTSGPITLAQVQSEFGGAAPISLSEYYRNGPFTPDHSGNLAVPTGGTIRLSNFYGTLRGYKAGNTFLARDFDRTYFNNFGYFNASYQRIIYATIDKPGVIRASVIPVPYDSNNITRVAFARNGSFVHTFVTGSFAMGSAEQVRDMLVSAGDRVELWMGAGTGTPGNAFLKFFGVKHDGGEIAGPVPLTYVGGPTYEEYLASQPVDPG